MSEFYRHPDTADGLLGKCKACTRVDVRTNRAKRRDYYNEYDKARGRKRRKRRDLKKEKCRRATRAAIKRGELTAPACCQRCGAKDALEIHHINYDFPLWVLFLCRKCHANEHSIEGAL